jgi:hypothetical protein
MFTRWELIKIFFNITILQIYCFKVAPGDRVILRRPDQLLMDANNGTSRMSLTLDPQPSLRADGRIDCSVRAAGVAVDINATDMASESSDFKF